MASAAAELLEAGARIVVQGSGDPELADPFRRLVAAKPDRVALIERFDRAMARRIYAGSDFFLMPSRFEPCGQGQMIALRYGTPPVVHRTGGLADTVIDQTSHPKTGTGFVFDEETADGLLDACERAMALRAAGGKPWASLARPRHGGRLRLGDRLRAAVRGGVPARGRDPRGALTGRSSWCWMSANGSGTSAGHRHGAAALSQRSATRSSKFAPNTGSPPAAGDRGLSSRRKHWLIASSGRTALAGRPAQPSRQVRNAATVSVGWLGCGECGAPGIVITWSAP